MSLPIWPFPPVDACKCFGRLFKPQDVGWLFRGSGRICFQSPWCPAWNAGRAGSTWSTRSAWCWRTPCFQRFLLLFNFMLTRCFSRCNLRHLPRVHRRSFVPSISTWLGSFWRNSCRLGVHSSSCQVSMDIGPGVRLPHELVIALIPRTVRFNNCYALSFSTTIPSDSSGHQIKSRTCFV